MHTLASLWKQWPDVLLAICAFFLQLCSWACVLRKASLCSLLENQTLLPTLLWIFLISGIPLFLNAISASLLPQELSKSGLWRVHLFLQLPVCCLLARIIACARSETLRSESETLPTGSFSSPRMTFTGTDDFQRAISQGAIPPSTGIDVAP